MKTYAMAFGEKFLPYSRIMASATSWEKGDGLFDCRNGVETIIANTREPIEYRVSLECPRV